VLFWPSAPILVAVMMAMLEVIFSKKMLLPTFPNREGRHELTLLFYCMEDVERMKILLP
jgi:hypothetical protein